MDWADAGYQWSASCRTTYTLLLFVSANILQEGIFPAREKAHRANVVVTIPARGETRHLDRACNPEVRPLLDSFPVLPMELARPIAFLHLATLNDDVRE